MFAFGPLTDCLRTFGQGSVKGWNGPLSDIGRFVRPRSDLVRDHRLYRRASTKTANAGVAWRRLG
jgi:hypothetical protein